MQMVVNRAGVPQYYLESVNWPVSSIPNQIISLGLMQLRKRSRRAK